MTSCAGTTSCGAFTLRMRMTGDIDRRPGLAPRRLCPSATPGKRARRYWQLADSDDAL